MKQIKTFSLAFTYVGCFLGAGFISGQELWQFFGAFGNWGYVGFVLAALLFTVIGILFVRLTQMTKCAEMDKLLVPWDVKWLRAATGVIGALFLFFVVVSMSAGVGAMLTQLFRVPTWLGSAVFMLAVFLVALLGVSGMVNAFSAMIPILVLATVGFAVGAWCTFGTEGILQLQYTNTNPLMPNWFIATLTFVAYNILGGIGIMSPVGQYVREKSTSMWVLLSPALCCWRWRAVSSPVWVPIPRRCRRSCPWWRWPPGSTVRWVRSTALCCWWPCSATLWPVWWA